MALAAAAISRLRAREAAARAAAQHSGDPYSPWAGTEGWRLGGVGSPGPQFRELPKTARFGHGSPADGWLLQIGEQAVRAMASSGRTAPSR